MAARRLSLAFTADQLGQEGLPPAPRGLVLSELSDYLNEIEGVILNGEMRLDISQLSRDYERVRHAEIAILQEVLLKAGFELTIEYKNPFLQQLYVYEPGPYYGEWKSNTALLIRRLR